ncbi:MAG: RNA 2',3'-cyclic phosphodiesterase [Desulfobacterales bacterium]|nr:RNA 2',3'-cyclic phosphodiesterase [Desulfobacterales bacterium]
MAKIRSFLAIELPKELRGKLSEIQDNLKTYGSQVKWVKPESIHLTLKFFGNIEEKNVDDISKAVKKVTAEIDAFDLGIKGIGVFPNMLSPRVIWVGVESSGRTLDILHKETESSLKKIGFEPEERGFRAHLTLGRVKSLKDKRQLTEQIEKLKGCELGSFRVENLFLFKSDLRPTGAVYTKLETFNLGGSQTL